MDTNRREFIGSCLSLSLIPFLGTEPENEILKFCRDKLSVKLLKWQEEELLNMFDNTFYHYSQGRGEGNSYLLSVFAMCNFYLRLDAKILVTGSSYRQVKNVVRTCYDIQKNSKYVSSSGYGVFYSELSTHTILSQDAMIEGLPLNSEVIRGFRPDILLIDSMSTCNRNSLNSILAGVCTVNSKPIETIKTGKLVYSKPFHIIGSC